MSILLQKIRRYSGQFRRWLWTQRADRELARATKVAKAKLEKSGLLAILVDSNVLQFSVTHQSMWVQERTCAYLARVAVHHVDDTSREYRETSFLPGIAELGRTGHLKLYSSAELMDERFRHPTDLFRGGAFDYSLFADVPMESIDGFVFPTIGPTWMGLPSAKKQQQQRLASSKDSLYDSLAKALGPKSNQDAWHIATAERHGLFCFLTMDFKLLRKLESMQKREPVRGLKTRVWTPVQLAQFLELGPVSPRLLSYNDASFIVRPDLTMPEGRRRSRRTKKSG